MAKRHCGFFPAVLTVTEGVAAGKPFHLLPWHGFAVASLFGWQRSDGLRRFRMAWLETGKGQAKSPLMAGIGIDMMGYAGKERSEVYAIVPRQDRRDITEADAPEGWTWEKVGTRIVPQGMDHGKIVADLTAAIQSLTLIVLEQQDRIAALEAAAA